MVNIFLLQNSGLYIYRNSKDLRQSHIPLLIAEDWHAVSNSGIVGVST